MYICRIKLLFNLFFGDLYQRSEVKTHILTIKHKIMKRIKYPNNWEENENLRQIFKDETKEKLWINPSEDNYYFSEEYVYWLEERLLESNYGE